MPRKILDLNEDGKVDMGDIKHLLLRYEIILAGGLLLIILPVLNAMDLITVSSDTFWILAGVVITAEAILEIYHEKRKIKQMQFIKEDEER